MKDSNNESTINAEPAPYGVGLFLGEDQNGFNPSPVLIDLIAQKSNKKVYVNSKAEWLFICGRDVFVKSIIKSNIPLVDGETVLIQNKKDDNLGYGQIKGKVIKNLLDKGEYLRCER